MRTRYRRNRTERALDELLVEVRALRAEVACLRANQVQIVPMPYPQPYPVYPQQYSSNPFNPWHNPIIAYGTTTIIDPPGNLTLTNAIGD